MCHGAEDLAFITALDSSDTGHNPAMCVNISFVAHLEKVHSSLEMDFLMWYETCIAFRKRSIESPQFRQEFYTTGRFVTTQGDLVTKNVIFKTRRLVFVVLNECAFPGVMPSGVFYG